MKIILNTICLVLLTLPAFSQVGVKTDSIKQDHAKNLALLWREELNLRAMAIMHDIITARNALPNEKADEKDDDDVNKHLGFLYGTVFRGWLLTELEVVPASQFINGKRKNMLPHLWVGMAEFKDLAKDHPLRKDPLAILNDFSGEKFGAHRCAYRNFLSSKKKYKELVERFAEFVKKDS